MAKPKMVCSVHRCKLERSPTRFGARYDCPHKRCTVMCWAGKTSTPADQETRDARIKAHAAFDELWVDSRSRRDLYSLLARAFDIPKSKCHIGMFNARQCEQLIKWCEGGCDGQATE